MKLELMLFFIVTSYPPVTCSCPRLCRCSFINRRVIVYCQETKLFSIPYGVPTDVEVLHLQGNNITNNLSSEKDLEKFVNLRFVDLSRNNLSSFPKFLPNKVEEVDLHQNSIKFISRHALKGLVNLKILNLDNNSITDAGLSSSAFHKDLRIEEISMSSNLLSFFPKNLPCSLRHIRLSNNRVDEVTRDGTSCLSHVEYLDLSRNLLRNNVEEGCWYNMINLKTLDLSNNKLTTIPKRLPENIEKLVLSGNQIKFLHIFDSGRNLKSLDLSFNVIENVEANAFAELKNLRYIELHENHWRCDCYLMYFKHWFKATKTIISHPSTIQCSSPRSVEGVAISSIDQSNLRCNSIDSNAIEVVNVTSSAIAFDFYGFQDSDPDYISYFVFYGMLQCDECSPTSLSASTLATSIMSVSDEINVSSSNVISKLHSNTVYVLCARTSYVALENVTIKSCFLKRTKNELLPVSSNQIPPWSIAGICCLLVGIVAVTITLFSWQHSGRNKSSFKPNNHYFRRHSRNSLIHRSADVIHDVTIQHFQGSDVSSGSSENTATLDARREFDVTLLFRTTKPVASRHSLMTTTDLNNTDRMRRCHGTYDGASRIADEERRSWCSLSKYTASDSSGVYVWKCSAFHELCKTFYVQWSVFGTKLVDITLDSKILIIKNKKWPSSVVLKWAPLGSLTEEL